MESLLIWLVTAAAAVAIVVPYAVRFGRRNRADAARRAEARALGADRPVAQYPLIDEAACIGCGSCVAACPERSVLGIVDGRAVIVNGLKCVGHGRCAEACPVGAIRVGLGDVGARDDIPRLTDDLESTVPGVLLAGELTGFALIRNAVAQGTRAAEAVARRVRAAGLPPPAEGVRDLVIVGAGPAGLSAALVARREGLSYVVLDQQGAGGTILQYPRKKVVLTQPVDIPLWGRLDRSEYAKEDLLAIWQDAMLRFELHVRTGERLEDVMRAADGTLMVRTTGGTWLARHVILALGRRGTPRKLGVHGEELPKVAYKLLDAEAYRGERILVVGGGDSAVEAALGLARQPGNLVTLSYRKERLFRIKQRNEKNFADALGRGELTARFGSEVLAIGPEAVRLRQGDRELELPNDYVFVFAGGEPPWPLLRRIGIGFGGAGRDAGRAGPPATAPAPGPATAAAAPAPRTGT